MRRSKRSLTMVGLAGFFLLSGCMSYTQIEPTEAVEHGQVRITTTSDYGESLCEPHLRADTLVGRRASGDTLQIPLARVEKVEAGKTDAVKTAGLILLVPTTALVVGAVI